MRSRLLIAIVFGLLGVGGVAYHGASKDTGAKKPDNKGHFDFGAEVSFNVYVATVKLLLNLRDVDTLLIKAIDWTNRHIRYFLNGREQLATLTPEQIRILREKGQAPPPPKPVWVPGKPHPSQPNVVAGERVDEWRLRPGYTWVNNNDPKDWRVRWVPGVAYPHHPNVISQSYEEGWSPAPGYRWHNDNVNDLRVVPESKGPFRSGRCRWVKRLFRS